MEAPILSLRQVVKHYTLEQGLISKLFRQEPPEPIRAVDGVSTWIFIRVRF